MRPLTTNKQFFNDKSGNPLDKGLIYVGQQGTDPTDLGNQVDVFYVDDSGNATDAAQPLRTGPDGQFQFNGKRVIAVVDGTVAISIYESKQSSSGALERGKLIEYSGYVEDFGTAEAEQSQTVIYYQTLSAAKQDTTVVPGDYIVTLGAALPTDNLGAEWFVITPAGETSDDIDYFSFDNGLQGRRIKNFTEEAKTAQDKADVRANIETLDINQNLADVPNKGAARTELDVYSKAESGVVSEIGTRSTDGTWSLSVTPYRPVYITAESTSGFFVSCLFKVTSGASGGVVGEPTHYFGIRSNPSSSSTITPPSTTIIPTSSTLVLSVLVGTNNTLRAYQW